MGRGVGGGTRDGEGGRGERERETGREWNDVYFDDIKVMYTVVY